jgi:protoheme IX farnesyltransferase
MAKYIGSMEETHREGSRVLRRLAWTGAVLATGLIVLGGVVRITGSGLGCGEHWPRCNGHWFPPLDLPTMIEVGHRWVAALVSLVVLTVASVAWIRHREEPRLRNPATLALVLLVVQVLLGAVTVKLSLPPSVVIVHLANAMILLATLIVTALRAGESPEELPARQRPIHPDHRWVLATAALGFMVILLGANVANLNAGLLCLGFPLCSGRLMPPGAPLAFLPWVHRLLAFVFLGLAVALTVRLQGRRDLADRGLVRSATLVLLIAMVQIGVGASMVLALLPPALRATHLLIGTLLWAALVVLVFRSRRTPVGQPDSRAPAIREPSPISDLVTLTKPRIISLLLVTTVAPMFITPAGLPSPALVFWVIVGGYLMAGGANAINMWFDRDIDQKMSRTRLRPIPAGRIRPPAGLAFGIGLGAVAFLILWLQVNLLSAILALSGLLFYVFVYTVWLKRSSPQNIVIGGAAGAFPPLVGWTAVTGHLDLAALYLFAIVFYWTPPHFWALALIKRAEYARAGIPMLPVVKGEQRTKFEMLTYTLILLPLTVIPILFGALGAFYGVAAGLLGARLLWYCVRLLRERSTTPVAWGMYRYSLLYLALLFVAMGIDRALPFGHWLARQPVLILDQPDPELATPTGVHLHR